MDLTSITFERQYRTVASEGYSLRRDRDRIARLDVHFASQSVYATLVLFEDVPEDELLPLIEYIDESIVLSAETPRDDFYVTVFQGAEVGFYSDDFKAERGGDVGLRPGARLDRELTEDPGSADD